MLPSNWLVEKWSIGMPKLFIQLSGSKKFSGAGRSKCMQALEHSNQDLIGYATAQRKPMELLQYRCDMLA